MDISTQKKIEKGKRLVELLKQPNYSPIPFYKQVVLIYAGVMGYLDEVPLARIAAFEQKIYDKMETSYKSLADAIKDKQQLSPEIEQDMQTLIVETIKEL